MRENAHKPASKADISRVDERVDACVRRMASEIIKSNARVEKLEEGIAKNTQRILAAVERSNQLMETANRAIALHGQTLSEIQSRLQNHKKRIADLEAAGE